jgi:CRP-like cAMP-binding protein
MVGLSMKLAHLRATPPFSHLDEEALADVAVLAEEVAVPTGYILVYDGDWGEEVFVVVDGTAKVIVDGRCEVTLGPGAIVGAGALAPGVTVVAASPMRFFVFDREGFASLAPTDPPKTDSRQ